MTDVIERFGAQLASIEPEQARQMRLAWDMEDPAPRKVAWATATAALRAAGRGRELDELRETVNAWAGDKGFNVNDLIGAGSPERTRQEARVAALPAAMDAGLAAVAAEFLDQDQRYLLAKPYRNGLTGDAGRSRRGGRAMRRPAGP